jgi:hypothetical protein
MAITKEIRAFYHNYLLDSIDGTDYDVATETPEQKMAFVLDCLNKEYGHMVERVGQFKALAEWLSGLPGAVSLPYTYCDILAVAKKSGSLPQDATEKQEDRVCENYWNYMAMRITELFRKYT